MKLDIYRIKYPGILSSERVLLIAKDNVDAWDYGIGKSQGSENGFFPILNMFFMLPRVSLGKGEVLSICTKSGVDDFYNLNGKLNVHRIHMGFEEAIWSDADSLILVNINNYKSSPVKKISSG